MRFDVGTIFFGIATKTCGDIMDKMSTAKQCVLWFLKNKETFTLSELKSVILKNKGVMRVSIGYTVKEYLEDMDRDGVVRWRVSDDGKDIIYKVVFNKHEE